MYFLQLSMVYFPEAACFKIVIRPYPRSPCSGASHSTTLKNKIRKKVDQIIDRCYQTMKVVKYMDGGSFFVVKRSRNQNLEKQLLLVQESVRLLKTVICSFLACELNLFDFSRKYYWRILQDPIHVLEESCCCLLCDSHTYSEMYQSK